MVIVNCLLVVGVLGYLASPASAICQGSGCLPGLGYTLDRYYGCGLINNDACYYDGTRSRAAGILHTWGYSSAIYNGSGSVRVFTDVGTINTSVFGAGGTNLARACYYNNCNDQTFFNWVAGVGNNSGYAHTITGHAEA